MNLIEAHEFFKSMNPGKNVKLEFDQSCLYQIEIIHTDSLAHIMNHVEYRKVKVTVEGNNPVYVPIAPHREIMTLSDVKKYMAGMESAYIHPDDVRAYKEAKDEKEKKDIKSKILENSGMSEKVFNDKMK